MIREEKNLPRRDEEQRENQTVQNAILAGYRDLAAGRFFASSGDFKTDMNTLECRQADFLN